MRILVISMMYAPDSFRINEITQRLVQQGHSVQVITGLPDYATSHIPKEYRWFRRRKEQINGCQVVRIPTTARRKGVLFRAMNYASFAFFGAVYARFCKKPQVDAILVYETSPVFQIWPATVLKKRLGVPLTVYCLDIWPEALKAWKVGEGNPVFKAVRRISRRLFCAADTVAVSSLPFIPYLEQLGVSREKLVYLPQECDDIGQSAQPSPPRDTYDFYFCGNVGAVQNVDCLLRAAALLPADCKATVHIVGDGSELEACRALAQQLSLQQRVVFHGRVPQSQMPQIYEQADALVITLRGGDAIGQTLPAKVQSYTCVGKPILAAAGSAVCDVITEADCGICVPAGAEALLAEAMQQMVQQQEVFREKGYNGRRYYLEHFTGEQFDAALTDLLKGN